MFHPQVIHKHLITVFVFTVMPYKFLIIKTWHGSDLTNFYHLLAMLSVMSKYFLKEKA